MSQDVKQYFNRQSRAFDALYGKGAEQIFNRIFRRPLYDRFRLTMEELTPCEGRYILDVGCGSGIYAVELAERGARVVGVDFSEEMIRLAKKRAHAVQELPIGASFFVATLLLSFSTTVRRFICNGCF